jgi:small subunit ribosomal protein S6
MSDRQYELVYILPPDTTEQQVTELHQQIEAVVARLNGQIEKTENWGRRKLAYEIGHNKEGVYVLDVINGSGELMKELDRRLKVMDLVIRHLVVRVDEEKKVVDRTRTKRQTESERRRVKRGLPPQRQPGEGRPAADADEGDDDHFDGMEV